MSSARDVVPMWLFVLLGAASMWSLGWHLASAVWVGCFVLIEVGLIVSTVLRRRYVQRHDPRLPGT